MLTTRPGSRRIRRARLLKLIAFTDGIPPRKADRASASLPPCGEGLGMGVGPLGDRLQKESLGNGDVAIRHYRSLRLFAPHPCPSPQGGGVSRGSSDLAEEA